MNLPADSHAAPCANVGRTALLPSLYDKVVSLMTSLLIVVGLLVFCMFVAWLGAQYVARPLAMSPYLIADGGVTDGKTDDSMRLDAPFWQDIYRETDLAEPEFASQAEVVEALVIRAVDVADELPIDLLTVTGESGGTRQSGSGDRPGAGDGPGQPGETLAKIPPEDRWEIRFREGLTLAEYARQLDFFQIELGVVRENDLVVVTNLAQETPISSTVSKAERREWLVYVWKSGRLREADRQLIQKGGVVVGTSRIVQIYPASTEAILLARERAFRNTPAHRIKKTVFEAVEAGGGYDFQVVEQIEL